ncbi:TetR/AcrR family transcriptional regulator [Demequina sp.]|uniref:TetR/AcrR family transcriptional regulator n=1 Tax=Demequina sp. TaxID=2050685 RepID=UPI0025C46C58|nr:TetR/AcrR family transcriptional regulator [Demequina sp.]
MNPQTPSRAPRMSVEDRRESILDAVVPLLLSQGADVTTKDIADAACIAEGTIFRAFADKEELIQQAVARFMDPEPTFRALEQIDPSLALKSKVRAVVDIFRERSAGIVGIISALGHRKPAHDHGNDPRGEARAAAIFATLFAPDSDSLRVDQSLAVFFIRLLAFGSSMPMFTADRDVETDELVDFILRGIVKEGR